MRAFALCLALVAAAGPAAAQTMQDRLTQLFIFGEGDDALFLGGSGGSEDPSVSVHGDHFVPSAVQANATILDFLTAAVAGGVANLPVSASSAGETFSFQHGTPVRTSVSAGPIFAERAQTLGRGRLFVGVTRTGLSYRTIRGAPLDDLQLAFTHENVDFPNCDAVFGGDCSEYGVPDFENEVIAFDLDLDVRVRVTSFLLTWGVSDRLDVGVVLPLVETSLEGVSRATLVPFGPGPAVHFFGGTPEEPELSATRISEGSASGLGDVSVRAKLNLRQATPVSVAVLAEGRFPTGSEDDLLGAGGVALRGLAIVSGRFGTFSPHANVGYHYRGKDRDPDAFLLTGGFDQLLAPWATLAADVIAELQVGRNRLHVPEEVMLEAPFTRSIRTSSIPDRRDDMVSAALGLRLAVRPGLNLLGNALFPLNRGGLRPDVLWTVGAEYTL